MSEKKPEKETKDLRSKILDEISKYKFGGDAGKKVKRFVWDDPTKEAIKTEPKPLVKNEPKSTVKLRPEVGLPKEPTEVEVPKSSGKKRGYKILTTVGLVVGTIIVLVVIFYQARLYKSMPALARALPWPAAYVNGQYLPLSDFLNDVDTLVGFYERAQEADGSTNPINIDELEIAVADRMVAEAIVLNFTTRNKISVSDEMIAEEQLKIVEDFGSEAELANFINQNYNWTLVEFKEKVIGPYLRRQQIEIWFQQNTSAQEAAADSINGISSEISNGMPFEEAAQKYSQDETNALYGGFLGVFEEGVMVPEFEQALLGLQVGEVSEPVKTPFGWHIIRRESLPADQDFEKTDLAASHILIKVFDFDKWLQQEKAKSTVWMFINLPKIDD